MLAQFMEDTSVSARSRKLVHTQGVFDRDVRNHSLAVRLQHLVRVVVVLSNVHLLFLMRWNAVKPLLESRSQLTADWGC